MKILNTLLAAGALVASGAAANAAAIYADSVIDVTQGTCIEAGGICTREDPLAALGAPDGLFHSMGLGGSIELGFAGSPFGGSDASVFELTSIRDNDHDEAIEVFSVFGGVATSVGTITNLAEAADGSVGTVTIAGKFDSILLVDITLDTFASTTSFDGFDLDAISLTDVSPIPLPAAGFMLLAGLGGLGMMRRKKA